MMRPTDGHRDGLLVREMRRSLGWLAGGCIGVLVAAGVLNSAAAYEPDPEPATEGEPAEPMELPEEEDEAPKPPVENPILSRARVLKRDPMPGDHIRIVSESGRVLEGTLVRQEVGLLTVRISGAEIRIEIQPTDRVEVLESVRDRYRQVRESIPDEDHERILALAEWLRRQGMYEEALSEVEHVLSRESTNAEALRLKRILVPQIELTKRRMEAPREEAARPRRELARPLRIDEFPLLTAEQINLMKVYEIDLKDPPKVVISRETVTRLLERYAGHPLIPTTRQGRDAFYKLDHVQILDVMFRVQARELYPEVQVLGNPRSMEVFRDRVHSTWLINAAAATQCHGGSKAGRLVLMNRRPTSPATVYTNFLILDRFETADGKRLIDWSEPENSPLLHMGLARTESLHPHPDVENWTPIFTSRDSRRFKQAVDWIKMMYRPRPEYPVEYTAPTQARPEAPEPGPSPSPADRVPGVPPDGDRTPVER